VRPLVVITTTGAGQMAKLRDWGFWTEQKMAMLADYLPRFTTASSQRAKTTIYLDLFSGDVRNLSRSTGEEISGSPKVALDALPRFGKVVLFDLPAHAVPLEQELRRDYPDRDITVWPGDCNETLDAALAALAEVCWAPTFAFVDQYAAEIRWETLEKLASFKKKSKFKTELWMLFAHSMLPRGLASEDTVAVERFTSRIDAMFGTQQWQEAYEDKKAGLLGPADLRAEFSNLMRWRLETVLGYAQTHSFEMRNTTGQAIYTMIFATDNDAGNRIMSHIYKQAAERQPQMLAEARARKSRDKEEAAGVMGLFDPPAVTAVLTSKDKYAHQAPRQPYQRNQATG
jgi:three-Cys-motif partner protein